MLISTHTIQCASYFSTSFLFSSPHRLRKQCLLFGNADGCLACHGNADRPSLLWHTNGTSKIAAEQMLPPLPLVGEWWWNRRGIRVGGWQINPIVLAAASSEMLAFVLQLFQLHQALVEMVGRDETMKGHQFP